MFCLGFLWFFLISMQTRIVAFADNFYVIAIWTFLVSIVWVYLIKCVALNNSNLELISYAIGTSTGCVAATFVHKKIKNFYVKKDNKNVHNYPTSQDK